MQVYRNQKFQWFTISGTIEENTVPQINAIKTLYIKRSTSEFNKETKGKAIIAPR